MKRSLVLACLLFALPARADVVRTLERGVRIAGRSTTHKSLFLRKGRVNIELRSDAGPDGHGVITIGRGYSQHGYFPGSDGKLSVADHKELSTVLAEENVGREHVVLGLKDAIRSRKAEVTRLAGADKKIDGLLASIQRSPNKPLDLHNGRKASVTYEPRGAGGMLVVYKSTSQSAIFLGGNPKDGYSLSAHDRAELASVLLAQ